MTRRSLFWTLAWPVLLPAKDASHKVDYVGGTLGSLKSGAGQVRLGDPEMFRFAAGGQEITVPYERINLVEYGQKVDRRYVAAVFVSPLFLLTKKRQHFVTVGYRDDHDHQQALIFRVQGNAVRSMLVSLEVRSGQKVQFQDNEARRAGRG